MPIYHLQCKSCGKEVERIFNFAADAKEVELAANWTISCACGAMDWKKLPTAPSGFQGLPTPKFHNGSNEDE